MAYLTSLSHRQPDSRHPACPCAKAQSRPSRGCLIPIMPKLGTCPITITEQLSTDQQDGKNGRSSRLQATNLDGAHATPAGFTGDLAPHHTTSYPMGSCWPSR